MVFLLSTGLAVDSAIAENIKQQVFASATDAATDDVSDVGSERLIHINMKNGDVRSFIEWMATEQGKNIIIDPRVKGKITVLTKEAMAPSSAWQVFKAVLKVNGFVLLEKGGMATVVPDTLARSSGAPYLTGTSGDEDTVIRVIRTRYIPASLAMQLIKPLVPPSGYVAALQDSNSLLILDRSGSINDIENIIQQIDKRQRPRIEFVALTYANAKEVVSVLIGMLGKQEEKLLPHMRTMMAADERTNTVLLSGPEESVSAVKGIINRLDQEEEISDEAHVIYLHYLKASEAAEILKDIMTSLQKRDKNLAGEDLQIALKASDSTNSLIISAPNRYIKTVQRLLSKLDIRRAQVYVEAVIVEVGDNRIQDLGVQWNTSDSSLNGDGWFGGTRLDAGAQGSLDGFYEGDSPALGAGLSLGFYRNGSLRGLIRAFSGDDQINILSTPNLITLDNEEGKIVVGENVPFVTGQSTSSSSSTDNPFQTIERKDVGIKLTITPQVNKEQSITLDVFQEISSVTDSAEAADIITRTRSIDTKVQVESGSILVLGGLISDEVSGTVQKVPVLGDMPFVGRLFRSDKKERKRKNLMVFLKPTILQDTHQVLNVTGGKYSFMRAQQQALSFEGYNAGVSDDERLILPALNLNQSKQ